MKINTHQCYSLPPGCWTGQRWWTRPGPSLSMQWLSDHSDNMMTRQNCKIDGKYVDSENQGMWLRKVHTSLWFTRPAMHFIPDTKTQLLAIAIGKDRLKAEKMVPTNLVELWPPASQFLGHLNGFYQTLICHDSRQRNDQDCKIVKLCIRFASLEPWKWQMLSSYC